MATNQDIIDEFKRDLYQTITARKRQLEIDLGLSVKDIELVFVDASSLGDQNHLLNNIIVTIGD